jgi:hypothetical protein
MGCQDVGRRYVGVVISCHPLSRRQKVARDNISSGREGMSMTIVAWSGGGSTWRAPPPWIGSVGVIKSSIALQRVLVLE